jgi:hypothetical protein
MGPPPAGLQRDKRPAIAEDLVIDVDAADLRDGHGRCSLIELSAGAMLADSSQKH